MSLVKSAFFASFVLLAAACGGSAFSAGDNGSGGSNGVAATAGDGTSSGNGGMSSGNGGSGSSGGSTTMGGKTGSAGSVAVAGSSGVAGAGGNVAGPGCDDVVCLPVMGCSEGYELAQPSGACCKGCVPKPGGVACREIACPPDDTCPRGYVRGDLVGGCCYDCVPDPLYCETVDHCVTADRPRSCCGCPEAISIRTYEADECWSDVKAPRMLPQRCYPQVTCDAICAACPAPGALLCENHRCALAAQK